MTIGPNSPPSAPWSAQRGISVGVVLFQSSGAIGGDRAKNLSNWSQNSWSWGKTWPRSCSQRIFSWVPHLPKQGSIECNSRVSRGLTRLSFLPTTWKLGMVLLRAVVWGCGRPSILWSLPIFVLEPLSPRMEVVKENPLTRMHFSTSLHWEASVWSPPQANVATLWTRTAPCENPRRKNGGTGEGVASWWFILVHRNSFLSACNSFRRKARESSIPRKSPVGDGFNTGVWSLLVALSFSSLPSLQGSSYRNQEYAYFLEKEDFPSTSTSMLCWGSFSSVTVVVVELVEFVTMGGNRWGPCKKITL